MYNDRYDNSHALIVGVDYAKDTCQKPLGNAIENAKKMADILTNSPHNFRVNLLLGNDATTNAISESLNRVKMACEENDRFIFYFSGFIHGFYSPIGATYYFPHLYDTDPDKPGKGLLLSDILRDPKGRKAKHQAYIIDYCLSKWMPQLLLDRIPRALSHEFLLHHVYHILTAGSSEEESDSFSMTNEFVKVLQNGIPGQETPLTFNQIALHIQHAIYDKSAGRQTPVYGLLEDSSKGQMLLFPSNPNYLQSKDDHSKLTHIEPVLESVRKILPPPFEWCEIPAGYVRLKHKYGDSEPYEIKPIKMAKYLVTYAQFREFLNSDDIYYLLQKNRYYQLLGQEFGSQEKHPRMNVTWYEAMAFCRWLSVKIGFKVRLPTEWEWQWAAQGADGREYPWGNEYNLSNANFANVVKSPTPVDRYPQGASPFGVLDMAGNVWEWCLNNFKDPHHLDLDSKNDKAVRGGRGS